MSNEPNFALSRRSFLGNSGAGIGAMAFATLLDPSLLQAAETNRVAVPKWRGVVNPTHHKPKVKRIIYLCMAGGPSHLETLDYKPKLAAMHGKPMPQSYTKGQPIAQLQGRKLNCLAPQHKFKKFGKSGDRKSVV